MPRLTRSSRSAALPSSVFEGVRVRKPRGHAAEGKSLNANKEECISPSLQEALDSVGKQKHRPRTRNSLKLVQELIEKRKSTETMPSSPTKLRRTRRNRKPMPSDIPSHNQESAEDTASQPEQDPDQELAEEPVEEPAEKSSEESVEEPEEESVEESEDESAEESVEEPAEKSAEESEEESDEEPVVQPVEIEEEGVSEATSVGGSMARVMRQVRVAKVALQTAPPVQEQIQQRDKEQHCIEEFILSCLKRRQGGSLYCVGQPGTGKTITLQTVLRRMPLLRAKKRLPSVRSVFVNAMSVPTARGIYSRIAEEIGVEGASTADKARQKLDKFFLKSSGRSGMNIVVVDEIDGLLDKTHQVLYELFEWASRPSSSLILIGIANALEMTNRFLPRLEASGCEPTLLTFKAYSHADLVEIMAERLGETEGLFDSNAVQLLARKVASSTGDARKFLELSRKSLDVARKACALTAPLRVSIQHVSQVLKTCFDSPHVSTIRALPQHQQIVLCIASLLLHMSKKRKEIAVGTFHLEYCKMSRTQMLPSVSAGDFADIITALVCQGLIDSKTSKGCRGRLLSMRVQRQDIEFAFSGRDFFVSLLQMS